MSKVEELYKRTDIVGRGKFGVVYKGVNLKTSGIVAIKVLNLDTAEDEVYEVQQEIAFLSHLKSAPNVTHYHGSFLNGTRLWIIMDYCAGGSLRSLLRPGKIEEKYIGVIVRELLIALQHVHKAGVIHRDIKAANVLITKEGHVQLCDFGVAAQLTASALKRTTMAGTPYWMAPEVIMEGATYNVKVDIWSLGITVYEIATGNPPYCDKDAMRAMHLITKDKPPRLEGKQYSPLLKEFIALCLDENPEERPMADDLLKSRFVKFHRPTATPVLKELVSRYLVWRETSRRDSGIYEEEKKEPEEHQTEVKWDFDSLSSSEYIVDNPPQGMESPLRTTSFSEEDQDTLQANTFQANTSTTLQHDSTRKPPKSLLQLFHDEVEEEESNSTAPPTNSPVVEIEIPNMEDLSIQPTKSEIPQLQRRPTMATTTVHPPVKRNRTPSPKRRSSVESSPSKMTPSTNPSGSILLQPINSKPDLEHESVNQFGVKAGAAPLVMTPLTEKSLSSSLKLSTSPDRILDSIPETSHLTLDPAVIGRQPHTIEQVNKTFPAVPQFQTSLLLDNTVDNKARLVGEVDDLLGKMITALDVIEGGLDGA